MRKYVIQARLSDSDMKKFEEIRSLILFERIQGRNLVAPHVYSTGKSKEVTDADIIRFLINEYQFKD